MKYSEKEFAMAIEAMAEVTGVKLSSFLLHFYTDNLKKHGWEKVVPAVFSLMKDIKRFPTVVDIEEAMGIVTVKPPAIEDHAREAVSRIFEAISKFGWQRGAQAKEYIGELGWKLVERFGGWDKVTDIEEDQRMGLAAQMRELAISLQKYAAHGIKTGPALPGSHPLEIALQIMEKGTYEN